MRIPTQQTSASKTEQHSTYLESQSHVSRRQTEDVVRPGTPETGVATDNQGHAKRNNNDHATGQLAKPF